MSDDDSLAQLADDLDAAGQPLFAARLRRLHAALEPQLLPRLSDYVSADDSPDPEGAVAAEAAPDTDTAQEAQ
jgi:hypothetical protein